MTEKLPNFCRADDAMRAAESFFSRAGAICLRQSHAAQDMANRMFLAHAAQTTKRLAEALGDQRKGPDSGAQKTFVQYAPAEPIPTEASLDPLEEQGSSAPLALEHLDRSSRSWMNIFEHLRFAADTDQERELHEACGRLIDTWRRDLSIAYQQRTDI